MGKPTGFKEIPRETPKRRDVKLRILDWDEIYLEFGDRRAHEKKLADQGARCMDCGIPFCNNGCPLGNIIPEWNDLVYKNRWREAIDMLHKTNNFPEFTGRVCPAPCEESCVLGINIKAEDLRRDFDAIVLCGGATKARDLTVPGRELKGIHLAMDYLPLQNKRNLGDNIPDSEFISAQGKHVIILGGGDTGADCLGTAHRQGAASVSQFELLPEPPKERTAEMPWPYWPMTLRTSSAHEESAVLQQGQDKSRPAKIRDYSINTKSFKGENGIVKKLIGIRLEWAKGADGRMSMKEIAGSEFEMDC